MFFDNIEIMEMLVVGEVVGNEDIVIVLLGIMFVLIDMDGFEGFFVSIDFILFGVVLSDGMNSFMVIDGLMFINVISWDLDNLQIILFVDYNGIINF